MLTTIRTGRLRKFSQWLAGPKPHTVVASDRGFVAHPADIVAQLTRDWKPIYDNPVGDVDVSEAVRGAVCPGPPTPALLLPDLTATDLRHTIVTKKETASGGDCVSWRLLRSLPMAVWEEFCSVLQAVEQGDPWPTQLTKVLMAPIPRKDRQDRGPVGGLKTGSSALRPWSTGPGRPLDSDMWLLIGHQIMFHQESTGEHPGKTATWLESTLWEEAEEQQAERWGGLLDFSKYYDLLNFHFLRRALLHLGIDPRKVEPLYRWQCSHTRQVAYQGWLGPSFHPRRDSSTAGRLRYHLDESPSTDPPSSTSARASGPTRIPGRLGHPYN